jgi:signal transduction histidine kinase
LRLIPDRIATWMAATTILALVAMQIINGLVYFALIGSPDPEFARGVLLERVAATARIIDSAAAEDRPHLIAVLARPPMELALETERPKRQPEGGWPFSFADYARRQIQLALGDPDRGVLLFKEKDKGRGGSAWVPLRDGAWLSVTVAGPIAGPRRGEVALALTLVAIVVAPISCWAARKLSATLAALAQAAENLGVDSGAPPLKEAGPRELRIAIRAFNRMQERLKRFIDDRTRMLAAMSHDLRTPLTRLRLRAEFIEDRDQQRKMLAELEEMTAMIDATLAFAREDAEREDARRLDLGELVASVCDDAIDANEDVTFEPAPRCEILGRPSALRRAIANVVGNAVKYAGGASVRVAARGAEFVVEIDDDGPGIPEHERERVFAPFYRIETSRSRETGGTGLGLAVARSIVHAHGGDIRLADRAGGGLRVTILVPALPRPHHETERRSANHAAQGTAPVS